MFPIHRRLDLLRFMFLTSTCPLYLLVRPLVLDLLRPLSRPSVLYVYRRTLFSVVLYKLRYSCQCIGGLRPPSCPSKSELVLQHLALRPSQRSGIPLGLRTSVRTSVRPLKLYASETRLLFCASASHRRRPSVPRPCSACVVGFAFSPSLACHRA